MNLAPPLRGFPRPGWLSRPTTSGERQAAARASAKARSGSVLQRDRHQADYVILVVVVALSAIGILMVYSSSAIRGYLSPDGDTFAIVGPQIQWAVLGIGAMALMMRVDYRYLRLVSIPFFLFAIVLLVLVFVPQFNIVVNGSARWLKLGPLPAIHPAEIAKLALVIYLAHWFAKRGTKVGSTWGTVTFLIIAGPVIALVFKEPDLGTTMVITATAFTMWFVAGANLVHLGVMVGTALTDDDRGRAARLPAGADPGLARSVVGPARRWLPHHPGAARAGHRRALRQWPRPEPGVGARTPSTTSSSPRWARSSGSSARRWSSACSCCSRTRGSGSRCGHPIPSARCSRPASPRGSASRRSSTSVWSSRSFRSPASHCPSSAPVVRR